MKKVLFTALAVVAFSGVSMANNIANVEVVNDLKENNKNCQKVLILKSSLECEGCFNYAADQTDLEDFANDMDMFDFYQGEVDHCISHGGC